MSKPGILLNLDATRKRLAHLRKDPRVSLTVLDGERHISVQGTVRLEDDPDSAAIDRLARHYIGGEYPDRAARRVNAWLDVEQYHVWGY